MPRPASPTWRLLAVAVMATFLVLAATPAGAQAPTGIGLREAAENARFNLGATAHTRYLFEQADGTVDTAFVDLLLDSVTMLTFEGETKFGPIHPEPDVYDFTRVDRIADFAVEHGLALRGHVLLWHVQNPDWLDPTWTRDEALAVMEDHITTVVGHFRDEYPGLIVDWDVVNEPVDNDGTRRDTIWQQTIGDDYIEHAFRFARAAAGPDVALYLNDYVDASMVQLAEQAGVFAGTPGDNPFDDGDPVGTAAPGATGPLPCEAVVKCAALRAIVEDLASQQVEVDGKPLRLIDGVGFQAHIPNPAPSDYRGLTAWVGELGLAWAATELDVPIPPGSGPAGSWDHQVRAYEAVVSACLDDPACDTVVTWGLSDRYSWWNALGNGIIAEALHFDADLQPKPAAHRLHELLVAAASSTTPPAPAPTEEAEPAPDTAPSPAETGGDDGQLPATGGGVAAVGLLASAAAVAMRDRARSTR